MSKSTGGRPAIMSQAKDKFILQRNYERRLEKIAQIE